MRIPISAPPRALHRRVTLALLGLLAGCATESPDNTHLAVNLGASASPPPSPSPPIAPTPGPITALAVAPTQLTTLAGGANVPFTATGKDARGQNVALPAAATWSVTPGTGTATIDAQGLFTAGNAGTVTVNAAGGGFTAAIPVTIVGTPFTSIAINLPSPSPTPTATPTPTPAASPTPTPAPTATVATALTVTAGSVTPLAATAINSSGAGGAVTPTWTVSPAPNAYVDGQGNLQAFLSGILTLTASVPGANSQANISVAPGPAVALFVSGASGTVGVGTTVQLTASGRDRFNNIVTPQSLQWSISAGSGRASIDGTGLLGPTSPGAITVLAQAGSLSATVDLLLQSPTLTAIAPFSGRVGDVITASGSGFGTTPGGGANVTSCSGTSASTTPGPNPSATPLAAGVNTVYFSDGQNPTVPANEIVCWSDTQVQVKVPDGARPGALAVRIGTFVSNTIGFVRLFGITAP